MARNAGKISPNMTGSLHFSFRQRWGQVTTSRSGRITLTTRVINMPGRKSTRKQRKRTTHAATNNGVEQNTQIKIFVLLPLYYMLCAL